MVRCIHIYMVALAECEYHYVHVHVIDVAYSHSDSDSHIIDYILIIYKIKDDFSVKLKWHWPLQSPGGRRLATPA